MISKIIQKEKERQEDILKENDIYVHTPEELEGTIKTHKQSLINLKEYLEERLSKWRSLTHWTCIESSTLALTAVKEEIEQIKEDIKELGEMIKKHE